MPEPQQCWILNPQSEARDRTHNPWFLVGFVSAAPQRELHIILLLIPVSKRFLYPGLCVCVYFRRKRGFFTPNNFQMPAGCLRSQPNSDTVYLEGESDLTGKGLSPVRPPSTADTSCKSRLLPVLLTDYELEVSMTSFSGLIHFQEFLTELNFSKVKSNTKLGGWHVR